LRYLTPFFIDNEKKGYAKIHTAPEDIAFIFNPKTDEIYIFYKIKPILSNNIETLPIFVLTFLIENSMALKKTW